MTSGLLVLRVQTLAVIVGLVSCLWLDDVRGAENGKADVVLRNGKILHGRPGALYPAVDRLHRQGIGYCSDSRSDGLALYTT